MGGIATAEDLIESGWDALRVGEWVRAKECFEHSLSAGGSAEAFEGLGWAAYCLNEDPLTFDAREQAYRLYRVRGDDQSAARVAAWLAADWYEFPGEPAVGNGWLRRAHRLLDPVEPGPGHAWLAVHEASMLVEEDTTAARVLAVQAVELGRRFDVPELEMVGLGLEGVALVSEGDLGPGMARLDEATAAALSGEAEILPCVAWACCYLIAACEQVRDYDRAGCTCRAVGRDERARREIEAALAVFDQLGALGQRARGEALLARLDHPPPTLQGEPPEPLAGLTRREREVPSAPPAIADGGSLLAVVVGGSVSTEARERLRAAAASRGAATIDAAIGHDDPAEHLRSEILPHLKAARTARTTTAAAVVNLRGW